MQINVTDGDAPVEGGAGAYTVTGVQEIDQPVASETVVAATEGEVGAAQGSSVGKTRSDRNVEANEAATTERPPLDTKTNTEAGTTAETKTTADAPTPETAATTVDNTGTSASAPREQPRAEAEATAAANGTAQKINPAAAETAAVTKDIEGSNTDKTEIKTNQA